MAGLETCLYPSDGGRRRQVLMRCVSFWFALGATLTLGCGGRVESSGTTPSADAYPEVSDATEDSVESLDAAEASTEPPFDGTPARCLGRGNYIYAIQTDVHGETEHVLQTFSWRVKLDALYYIHLAADVDAAPKGYFQFVSRGSTAPLEVGLYENAQLAPPIPGRVGLEIDFLGALACLNDRGRFEVHQLEWTPVTPADRTPHLKRFLVTFEQKCDAYSVRGCLNFER